MPRERQPGASVKDARFGHGFWPYILPYVSFVVLAENTTRFPESAWLPLLALKPALPLALILFFWSRGMYPELRGFRAYARGLPLDLAVGFGTALLWMAPYVLVPEGLAARLAAVELPILGAPFPDRSDGFDPARAGEALAALALGLRFVGYVMVTPLFEELFIRSFILRFANVLDRRGDFRDEPVAKLTTRGLWLSTIFFVLGHVFWEWWVALPWVILTTLYFCRRGHIGAVIAVHAAANATILIAAMLVGDGWPDGRGGTLSLWFFV